MVELHYEDIEILDLKAEFFSLWFQKVCASYNKQLGDVSLVCCSDEYLLEMNNRHLNHDYYTDIITFNYNENDTISGDLFISLDRVKENAVEMSLNWKEEFYRVAVHGVLHLLGLNDKSDAEAIEMRCAEDKALKLVSRET